MSEENAALLPKATEEDENKAKLLIRYLRSVMRIHRISPEGMQIFEMLDVINLGMGAPCTFEQWLENTELSERAMNG